MVKELEDKGIDYVNSMCKMLQSRIVMHVHLLHPV